MTLHLAVDAGPAENLHRGRGIGRVVRELVAALRTQTAADAALELTILSSRPEALPPGAGRVRRRSVWSLPGGVSPWVPFPIAQRWRRFDAQRWLPQDLRATGATTFLATDPDAVPIVPGVATVAILYDFIPLLHAEHPGARAAMQRQCEAWRRCAQLIAISEATRADAIRVLQVPAERVHVAHLAADLRFRPLPDASARVLARWQQTRGYALYVGGFDPHKNVESLLQVFSASDAPVDLDLLIVGPLAGPGARLRARHNSARIRWLGQVADDDLVALYGAATALVLPSRTEGFGLTALEALRCGTPVLAAPVGALPEVCGEAAQWISAPTPVAMAQALRELHADAALRERLRDAGLQQAERFSWARTAAAVVSACRRGAERP